jgi:hypothetical protein
MYLSGHGNEPSDSVKFSINPADGGFSRRTQLHGVIIQIIQILKRPKVHGLSPREHYTNRAPSFVDRRCHVVPTAVISDF